MSLQYQPFHQPQPHPRPENLLPSALNRLRLHPLFNHIDEEVRFQQNPPVQRIHAVKRVVVRNQEAYPFRHIRRETERIQHLLGFGRAEALYADKNIVDTLRTDEELQLFVSTFEIDSTSHTIFDLKAQKTLPFRFGEISGYFWWGLLVLALLGAAAYALKRYLIRRGRSLRHPFRPAPELPPHVVAIKALEALHNQKLWQNNRHKQYYSGLTDILRTYIAARWGVGAMEMTSDEIIETMRPEELPDKARMDLTAILRDADLVKFAKATPDGEQNEADYLKAFYFVEETKLVVEEEEPEQPDPMQNQNA